MRNLFFLFVLIASVSLMSCDEVKKADNVSDEAVGDLIGGTTGAVVKAMEAEEAETNSDFNTDGPKVLIETEFGNMTLVLFNETPQHRDNFLKLVKEGYYNDLLFHRVINGFMIQGGDPDSKNAPADKQLGGGGPDYTIPAEFNSNLYHRKGALAAARTGGPANPEMRSSGSQFYIVQGSVIPEAQLTMNNGLMQVYMGKYFNDPANATVRAELQGLYQSGDQNAYNARIKELVPLVEAKYKVDLAYSDAAKKIYATEGGTPNLDGTYTVYGQVIEGLDVIDKIAAVQTGQADRPVKDVKMKVSVIEE